MAAKKYLSLEEAAQFLGVRTDEVIRLRERGELRGFADRGTWKFKSDDVEETKRRRQPDSSPDVPLMSDESGMNLDTLSGAKSDSDVRLVADHDLRTSLTGSSHDMPTIKKGKGSDSDVRLVGAGSGPLKGSDSDVKLIKSKDSDSGVKLSDSDSDVRLAGGSGRRPAHDSDSDVRLAPPRSDSDVRLAQPGSDSDVKLVKPGPDSSAIIGDSREFNAGDSVLLDEDSGITLEPDSGIQISGDSGIRLGGDSGLRLGGDSGIQLSSPADSGILLEGADSGIRFSDDDSPVFKLADDSGIKVKEGPKSGPKLGKKPAQSLTDDEIEMTAPMLFAGEDESRTDPDVPMLMDEEEEDLMPKGGSLDKTHAETSVILFDEEDAGEAATIIKKKGGRGLVTEEFEAESVDELEIEDEELLADDSDLDEMEVFESEDSDFDDSFSEGASAADISAFRGKIAVPVDQEWGGLWVAGLGLSTMAMALGVIVAVDLLRNVWGAGGAIYPGELVGVFGGFFK